MAPTRCLPRTAGKWTEAGQDGKSKHGRAVDEICGGWADDERRAEEMIRDIYESRTFEREREPLYTEAGPVFRLNRLFTFGSVVSGGQAP
ncbi:MAG TPA: hypothetical protein DEB39_08700 [Planctomycetaceae bacterium]|nr:hypothetical protein [Planctomycetaceae bacterium]